MKNLLFALLLVGSVASQASTDHTETEKSFAERLRKECNLPIEFDLHDYEYGRDESRIYSNNHFEDVSNIVNELSKACTIDPENREKLEKVRTIFIKRGSLGERKLIVKKNGDLVYLANRLRSEDKSKGDLIQDDLKKALKLSFVPSKKEELAKQAKEKAKEDAKEKERADARKAQDKKVEDQQKKITELTTWFQNEVKKISAEQGPDMMKKLEAAQKTYQDKLNAITSP